MTETALSPGTRIGPYEILSLLGSGGMGQVYRAWDGRLAREVALKVLHEDVSSDSGRLKRFENEARAASALNHPNIVTIYDVGASGAVSWIAMENVEGVTLRQALSVGAFPVKRLLPIAIQIADGLASAHEAAIVHRDLKPENVMLTKDDRVKILDFGLAKLGPTGPTGSGTPHLPAETGTFPGAVLGTVGYMSPEQAQGSPIDYRSDQFAFGSVVYEMATGKRAFHGKSAIDTLAAIINSEPEPIGSSSPLIPGPLRWVVERCLAKEPLDRYASTQDLARELKGLRDHLADLSGAGTSTAMVSTRRMRPSFFLVSAAVLAGFVGIYLAGRRAGEKPISDFERLTFRRGNVPSARFAPDGRTIIYSASWDDEPTRMFSARTDGRESTRLGLPDADLFSVSSMGELALSVDGTLARVPLAGGAPRELFEGVSDADWSPDGKGLAIVREVGGKNRLEFPSGKVLLESDQPIRSPRFSPDGRRIAFLSGGEAIVSVETVDMSGKLSVLSRDWKRAQGLAWSADGSEIWFDANERGWRTPLYAVTPSGRLRTVLRLPNWIRLQDISADGRVLVSLAVLRSDIRVLAPGETAERDLSWHEGSFAKDLTPDGKTLLFDEGGEGLFHAIYVRPTDGSPAKLIGEGRAMAISPDGRWAVTNSKDRGSKTLLVPTGAGEPIVLDDGSHGFEEATFFAGGKRILLEAVEGPSCVIDLPSGKPRPIAPKGVHCSVMSPDGKEAACRGPKGEGVIYAVDGGAARPIPGFPANEGEQIFQWSEDGRSLYVGRGSEVPMKVFRLDLTTGTRELWHEFKPTETGLLYRGLYYFTMTRDGRFYAYSSFVITSDLYLVTGLK